LACFISRWCTRPKTVTHSSTNRARRALTSFMRRTPLTATPRRQPDLMSSTRPANVSAVLSECHYSGCVCRRRRGRPVYGASLPSVHARVLGTAGPGGAVLPGVLLSPADLRRRAPALLPTSLRSAHIPVRRPRRRRPTRVSNKSFIHHTIRYEMLF